MSDLRCSEGHKLRFAQHRDMVMGGVVYEATYCPTCEPEKKAEEEADGEIVVGDEAAAELNSEGAARPDHLPDLPTCDKCDEPAHTGRDGTLLCEEHAEE